MNQSSAHSEPKLTPTAEGITTVLAIAVGSIVLGPLLAFAAITLVMASYPAG